MRGDLPARKWPFCAPKPRTADLLPPEHSCRYPLVGRESRAAAAANVTRPRRFSRLRHHPCLGLVVAAGCVDGAPLAERQNDMPAAFRHHRSAAALYTFAVWQHSGCTCILTDWNLGSLAAEARARPGCVRTGLCWLTARSLARGPALSPRSATTGMLETICAALILLNVLCAGCCECSWPSRPSARLAGRSASPLPALVAADVPPSTPMRSCNPALLQVSRCCASWASSCRRCARCTPHSAPATLGPLRSWNASWRWDAARAARGLGPAAQL